VFLQLFPRGQRVGTLVAPSESRMRNLPVPQVGFVNYSTPRLYIMYLLTTVRGGETDARRNMEISDHSARSGIGLVAQ
jgi:hypothetical protein